MLELFIKRSVLTTLLMVTILLFGIFSYRLLPVSVLPTIDFPTIQVSVNLPGADPETMASSVALPLEKQFSTIANVDSMNSINTTGSTKITLQFSLDRNIDAAAQDVQAAISSAAKQLPADLTSPPSYRKVNPADAPIFYLALTSETMPLSDVDYYAETIIAQRLSMLPGVAQVLVYGSQSYALRIQVDPSSMAANMIGLDEVANAISASNANLPTGALYGKDVYSTILAPGQLINAEEYNNLVLMYRNGSPVFLKNIGKAIDSVANDKVAAWYNNKRGIILAIQKQPNTNTLEVANSIKKILPSLRNQIPSGVDVNILFDRSGSIRESVNDVQFTLVLALVLVVLVIFIFLHNFSSTAIPTLALPLSIIGTFPIMYIFRYSIDNLSLMAFTLGVGFVVDDAIVVLENITRHLEQGKTRLQATIEGTKEIVFTVISMTLSLVAVFIPLLFMGGILGRLLHEFAVIITTAIILSGIISVTITPMLCNLFLRTTPIEKGSLGASSERVFEYIKEQYQKSLIVVIAHMRITMMIFTLIIIVTIYLFILVPKDFIPDEDSGQLSVYTEAAQNISLNAMIKEQHQVMDILLKYPHIEGFASSVGASGRNSSLNQGSVFISLKPRDQRPGANEIIKELRLKLSNLPGIKVYIQNVATISIGGQSTKSQYQYTLQGINQYELFNFASRLEAKLKTISSFVDVTSDLQISKPQTLIEIDRDKAAKLGISVQQIQNTLYSAYGGKQISTIYTSTAQYSVIMELDPKYQTDASMLSLLHIRSSGNVLVPLSAISKIVNTVGPLSISHLGQLPSVTLSFNLKTGFSLSQAIDQVNATISELKLPTTITGSFQGAAQAFQSSLGDMGFLVILAIIVIYIVLGMLYESFLHPITILSGLPTAAFGALITLLLFNAKLDIYGFVGLIMLIGIVKKNAIIIIDFALEIQRKHGKSSKEAVLEACLVRFRPIMMTTCAALVGALPIALAIGSSGETRKSLGLTVVGGLLTSQLLTLYITPVIFLYLESAKNFFKR